MLNFITRNALESVIAQQYSPFMNAATVHRTVEYNCRKIEGMISSRRLRSLFYAATSSPFRLRVHVPYSMEHDLCKSVNEKVIRINGSIEVDVSYEHHLIVSGIGNQSSGSIS